MMKKSGLSKKLKDLNLIYPGNMKKNELLSNSSQTAAFKTYHENQIQNKLNEEKNSKSKSKQILVKSQRDDKIQNKEKNFNLLEKFQSLPILANFEKKVIPKVIFSDQTGFEQVEMKNNFMRSNEMSKDLKKNQECKINLPISQLNIVKSKVCLLEKRMSLKNLDSASENFKIEQNRCNIMKNGLESQKIFKNKNFKHLPNYCSISKSNLDSEKTVSSNFLKLKEKVENQKQPIFGKRFSLKSAFKNVLEELSVFQVENKNSNLRIFDKNTKQIAASIRNYTILSKRMQKENLMKKLI